MACVGGILMYVAYGMIKIKEVKGILTLNKFHIAIMVYTAIMVPVVGFMWAVVSAIVIYALLNPWLGKTEKRMAGLDQPPPG